MGRSKKRSLMGVSVYPTARLETHFRTRPVPWPVFLHCFVPLRDLSHVAARDDLRALGRSPRVISRYGSGPG